MEKLDKQESEISGPSISPFGEIVYRENKKNTQIRLTVKTRKTRNRELWIEYLAISENAERGKHGKQEQLEFLIIWFFIIPNCQMLGLQLSDSCFSSVSGVLRFFLFIISPTGHTGGPQLSDSCFSCFSSVSCFPCLSSF